LNNNFIFTVNLRLFNFNNFLSNFLNFNYLSCFNVISHNFVNSCNCVNQFLLILDNFNWLIDISYNFDRNFNDKSNWLLNFHNFSLFNYFWNNFLNNNFFRNLIFD